MSKTSLAHISLFLANLIYAINYTFAKDVMPEFIQPSGFILLRVTGAFTLFSIIYFFFVKEKADMVILIFILVFEQKMVRGVTPLIWEIK